MLLNYLYAILEAETHIALFAVGLRAWGSCAPSYQHDSLTLDVMEATPG